MRKVLDVFAYSRELVNDELAEVRYRASVEPGFQESLSAMFPAPSSAGGGHAHPGGATPGR